MRKREIRIFLLSFSLAFLFVGGVGAALVWAHAGQSIGGRSTMGGSQPASAVASPTPDTIPTQIPAEAQPSPTPQPTPVVGVTHVIIKSFAFGPPVIQVPVGTTVTWTNEDHAPHTVTFATGMANSGMLKTGQSFRYTFTSPGTFRYVCAYHPGMVATVIVTV